MATPAISNLFEMTLLTRVKAFSVNALETYAVTRISSWRQQMDATKIDEFARSLKEAHGAKALVEASQKAREFQEEGDTEQAETWRRVAAALQEMQGPHES